MKIDLLPALNGDSVLVEYVPSHYFLIDGGYVDTYKDYLLPKLKEISENAKLNAYTRQMLTQNALGRAYESLYKILIESGIVPCR